MADQNRSYKVDKMVELLAPKLTRQVVGSLVGCVHCGRGFYTYEHFNPPFSEAITHDVNGIALLCGQCQLLATKGILSKETIQDDVNHPVLQETRLF